ncbi:MAG: dockerin type I domain-containing protein [Aeoliella sp.]
MILLKKTTITLLVLVAACLSCPALAQQVNWTGNGAGDNWNTAGNWSGNFGAPDLDFDEFGVISNGDTAFLNSAAANNGPAGIILGQNGGESGGFEIRSGGILTSQQGGATGTPGPVVVGLAGTGTLSILRGGTLNADDALSLGGDLASTITLGETGGSGTASLSVTGGSSLNRSTRIIGTNVDFATDSIAFGSQSTLIAEITSGAHSTIDVSGSASLDGILQVEFNGHSPIAGDMWDIVDATSLSGEFSLDTSTVGTLPNGLGLVLVNEAGGTNGNVARLQVSARLQLLVDRATGATQINNVTGAAVTLDGYEINSPGGALQPGDDLPVGTGWDSLEDQSTTGWLEIASPTSRLLAELNSDSSTVLNNSSAFDLGHAYGFSPTVIGQSLEDLTFQYSLPTGEVLDGFIEYEGPHNNLVLVVDPTTGEGALQNQSQFTISIDGYEVTSESSSLESGTWTSLEDNSVPGWLEIGSPSDGLIAELNSDGSTELTSGEFLSLGTVWDSAGTRDLQLQFSLEGEGTGDYNGDENVNAADFVVWRNTLGSTTDLRADGDGNGTVEADDYLFWKARYGLPIGTGIITGIVEFGTLPTGSGSINASAVPEPATYLIFSLALLFAGSVRRHVSR